MLVRLARWSLRLFGRPSNRLLIDRLHGEIVAAARNPVLFSGYGIDDTFEGRFESVVLHASLVLRRLRSLPDPAADVAQDLTDAMFRNFEVALRETGVADATVPKRMKALAEAFLGRSLAYDKALMSSGPELEDVLKRNVYAGRDQGPRLAVYVRAAAAALSAAPLNAFIDGPVPFPSPSALLMEATP